MPQIAIREALAYAIAGATVKGGRPTIRIPPCDERGNVQTNVSHEFYSWLCSQMAPGETFSDAISRLLARRGKSYAAGRE